MTVREQPPRPADVLVVDDQPANLQVLAEILKQSGHRVRLARSGRLALQAAAAEPPDLILLDILMPDLDGYETCRQLKADPRTRDIPVLFVSAVSEPLDKVRAFRVGGVDYLVKPFHDEEVAARVRTHLELRRQRRALEAQNAQLRELETLRDNLVHMLVHDLRAPLTGIQGGLELLAGSATGLQPADRHWLSVALESSRELAAMVRDMLDVMRLEHNQLPLHHAPADLAALARRGIEQLGPGAQARCDLSHDGAVPVSCDAELLVRVIANLVGNALKFSPEQTRVHVAVAQEDGTAVVRVTDHGPGIPACFQQRVFDKFGLPELRNAHRKSSTGLGLPFCRLAVEAHGGRIGLESTEGKGSTFWFKLPVAANTSCA
jgi:signal transduction histidine kinase